MRPPVQVSRPDRARIELAADLIAARVAEQLSVVLQSESAPRPAGPIQQIVYAPDGTGTSAAVYRVSGSYSLWPLSVMCRLTCSSAVADRSMALEYRDQDGVRFVVAGTQAVVTANGQQSFCWHPQAGAVTWPIEDAALAPLPQQYVQWGYQLALRVWNGDAGDVIDQVKISARFDLVEDSPLDLTVSL